MLQKVVKTCRLPSLTQRANFHRRAQERGQRLPRGQRQARIRLKVSLSLKYLHHKLVNTQIRVCAPNIKSLDRHCNLQTKFIQEHSEQGLHCFAYSSAFVIRYGNYFNFVAINSK